MTDKLAILFISRASLFSTKGGDTVQMVKTAEALRNLGVHVDIKLCNEKNIDYIFYDFIHFFNIRHPADMLYHIRKSKLPYVVSTIYVEYTKAKEQKVKGMKDRFLNLFGRNAQEYLKTVAKSILQGEKIVSRDYIWKGHQRSIRAVLKKASLLLPNSENEYKRLYDSYGIQKEHSVIPNAADTQVFNYDAQTISNKDRLMVICVARIEVRKNQLLLIKALNDTPFQLYLIGDPAPNHIAYYNECKSIGRSNIHFKNAMPHEELIKYYKKAAVHILPSWFETTGLSSLEALYCGCNIVVTKYGDTKDYFDPKNCFFCDPSSVSSIKHAVESAAAHTPDTQYINSLMEEYNWKNAAEKTLTAYQQVILNILQ